MDRNGGIAYCPKCSHYSGLPMKFKHFPPAVRFIATGASGQQGKTPVSHAGGAGSVTREAHH